MYYKQNGGIGGRSARCKYCVSEDKRKRRVKIKQAKLRAKQNRSTLLTGADLQSVVVPVPENQAATLAAFAELIDNLKATFT
jgi:hypothetical protein